MAKRISIINFKGGVGKTTLAFEFATGLVLFFERCRVLLIDMDHQSSLSIVCLGTKEWRDAVAAKKTTNEIFRPFIGQKNTFPGSEIIIQNPLRKEKYKTLDLVPAGLELDNIEIELTASHHGNAIQSEWEKRTLICQWIEETSVDNKYDYIIFDCPPATKIVSQNAIAASHGYVLPVVPEAVMERGAPHLVAMVKSGIDTRLKALAAMGTPRKMHVPDTSLVGVVITRIKKAGGRSPYTNIHAQHLKSLSREWGKDLLKPYIEDGTGVSETLSEGVPVYERKNTQNIGSRGFHKMFQELTFELKKRIDLL